MNRRTIYLICAVVAVVLAGIIYSRLQSAAAASQVRYRTATVKKGDVTDTVEASGVVQPLTTIDIKSRAGGRILKLAVDVGSIVKPGELIAKIDPSDTQSAYNQALADLTTSHARLAQSEEAATLQGTQGRTGIAQAQAGLNSAKVKLAQMEQQAQVQPALTKSAVQQAQADLTAAQRNYDQLRDATQPQDRAAAQASFDQAKANAVAAEASYTRQNTLEKKGYVAAQVVDTALASRDVAQASLTESKQRLATIQADQKAALAASAAHVHQASAALKTAQTNRVQIGLRRQDVAAARSAVVQAEASLQNAQAALIQNQMKKSDIIASQADIDKAKAVVKDRKIQLQDATVIAPRAGVILQKYVEEGTIISGGASLTSDGTNIVQLGDLSTLFVDTSVDESDVDKVSLGQKVNVSLDALPDKSLLGRVTRIDPQAINDRDVTTVHVRVQILHPSKDIKPGMNATCDFILRDVHNVLVIPSDAVKEGRHGGDTVRVLSKDNKVQVRPVVVGIVGSDLTEIKSGVNLGDKIVLGILPPAGGGPGGPGGPGGGFGGGQRGGTRGGGH